MLVANALLSTLTISRDNSTEGMFVWRDWGWLNSFLFKIEWGRDLISLNLVLTKQGFKKSLLLNSFGYIYNNFACRITN